MAITLKLTAEPDDGRCLSTVEMAELLDRAKMAGDDGTADIRCKTSVRGLVKEAWVVVPADRVLTPAQDFDVLAVEAHAEPAALPPPDLLELPAPGDEPVVEHDAQPYTSTEVWPPPPAGERTGNTLTIPAAAAEAGAPGHDRSRRRSRDRGRHAAPKE